MSVIVPVHNGKNVLPLCLSALKRSDLARDSWELIVVDDASTDGSGDVARGIADQVISLHDRPRGPAFARNRGAEAASGAILAFVDSDMSVHRDSLSQLSARLRDNPSIAAVFGSYDDRPSAPGFISQYRNLLHHYVHHRNSGVAHSFWAGCGAVRHSAFVDAGMFDERRYRRAEIEDVELGYRLRDKGYRLLLDPSIQATHHKKWTLPAMLRADFFNRGVPWTRLLLERGAFLSGGGASVGATDKLSVLLVGFGLLFLAVGVLFLSERLVAAAAICILLIGVVNRRLLQWFDRVRGPGFALGCTGMIVVYHSLNVASTIWGVATYAAGRSTLQYRKNPAP